MKKIFKILYIAVFLGILAMPLVLLLLVKGNEAIEKRSLAKFPAYISEGHLNQRFGDEFESWFNDRIPLRANLLSAANRIQGEWLHSPSSNVIVGKEGWLFYNTESADFLDTNALSDSQVRALSVTLSLIQENVESRGGRFTFVPVPNKSSVYSEKMPASFRKASTNNLDRITVDLRDYGVSFVDLKGLFLENKDPLIYHRRDSHWNYRGALLGYHAIMDSLGKDYESYLDASYEIQRDWRGDLDKLLYPAGGTLDDQYYFEITHDDIEFIQPKGVKDAKKQLEIFMSDKEQGDDLFTVHNKNRTDGSKLYMMRDSFGRALLPYMMDEYETSTFKRTDLPDLVSLEDGTDLVYEIAERNLARVIATAPFMCAPERANVSAEGLSSGGALQAVCETAGYGTRIYGAFAEDVSLGDGRVYVMLESGGETRTWEAFPVYESKLLGTAGENGFSLILAKDVLPAGEYKLSILAGGHVYDGGSVKIK